MRRLLLLLLQRLLPNCLVITTRRVGVMGVVTSLRAWGVRLLRLHYSQHLRVPLVRRILWCTVCGGRGSSRVDRIWTHHRCWGQGGSIHRFSQLLSVVHQHLAVSLSGVTLIRLTPFGGRCTLSLPVSRGAVRLRTPHLPRGVPLPPPVGHQRELTPSRVAWGLGVAGFAVSAALLHVGHL